MLIVYCGFGLAVWCLSICFGGVLLFVVCCYCGLKLVFVVVVLLICLFRVWLMVVLDCCLFCVVGRFCLCLRDGWWAVLVTV